MNNNQEIVIYKTEDNQIELEVRLENDTVWLDQKGIAALFNVNVPAISKHISNIFNEQELQKDRTVSKLETVQKEGKRNVKRNVDVYNLDMIISIGYRVNSKRATQFRIWSTNVLRKYLVNGYAINQQKLRADSKKYFELQQQIKTLRKVVENESFTLEQSKELVRIISDYASGLELIDKTDHSEVEMPATLTKQPAKEIKYEYAIESISQLKSLLKAHDLFGNEKDEGLKSALKTIFQSFDNKDLYPSVEEKAANLLYLIIKNHPFTDGNKRIGAFMFVKFLDLNGLLYKRDGSKLVEQNALVAIALLIAQSDPKQKELMVRLVVNLIVDRAEI